MSSLSARPWRIIIPVVLIALVGAACAPEEGTDTPGATEDGSEEALSGSIAVSGSSTVEPISAANAEKFSSQNPGVQISVDGPGTGDGFELFCNGDTDIADASRPIDPEEEIPACEKNGIEFVELKVAVDGISVLTSKDNTQVECLSFQDLYALLGPESEGFENWSDANTLGKEVGGSGDYPDVELTITAPGEESGTYDSFVEIVLEGIAVDERKQPEDGPFVRPDYQSSADDNVIIEGISGNATSLGWVGYAFFEGARHGPRSPLKKRKAQVAWSPPTRPSQRRISHRPRPLHLREQSEGRGEPGGRRLRRLLSFRRGSRLGVRSRLRGPNRGRRGRVGRCLGEPGDGFAGSPTALPVVQARSERRLWSPLRLVAGVA